MKGYAYKLDNFFLEKGLNSSMWEVAAPEEAKQSSDDFKNLQN